MKGPILVCKLNYSDSTKEFSQTDIIKMLEIFIDNIFVMFGGCVYSTDSLHSYGYQLCSSSRRLVPLFVHDKLYTGTSPEKEEVTLSCARC